MRGRENSQHYRDDPNNNKSLYTTSCYEDCWCLLFKEILTMSNMRK